MQELNESIARKVLETVDAGLVKGEGKPTPGQMCVEAAVCFAYGLPHSDNPPCVGQAVRAFKIQLNDARWSSNAARTAGMRAIAIAQLGSAEIDQDAFRLAVVEGTIRRVLPLALRAAARRASLSHAQALEAAAQRCEQEGTQKAALNAKQATAAAAAYAAYAAAAAYTATTATATAAAAAAAAAADAATTAYAAAADAARDKVLTVSADVCLQALIVCKSPGCEYLYLLNN